MWIKDRNSVKAKQGLVCRGSELYAPAERDAVGCLSVLAINHLKKLSSGWLPFENRFIVFLLLNLPLIIGCDAFQSQGLIIRQFRKLFLTFIAAETMGVSLIKLAGRHSEGLFTSISEINNNQVIEEKNFQSVVVFNFCDSKSEITCAYTHNELDRQTV